MGRCQLVQLFSWFALLAFSKIEIYYLCLTNNATTVVSVVGVYKVELKLSDDDTI